MTPGGRTSDDGLTWPDGAGPDHERFVSTYSEVPQAADVATSFKAHGVKAFVGAGLDGGQAGSSCSDHRHTMDHCWTNRRHERHQMFAICQLQRAVRNHDGRPSVHVARAWKT